jgi:myosin heavy subunit
MVLTEMQKKFYERTMTDGRQEDLVLMQEINPEGVASILTERFYHEDMYTAIGPVLIAVNPYRYDSSHSVSVSAHISQFDLQSQSTNLC